MSARPGRPDSRLGEMRRSAAVYDLMRATLRDSAVSAGRRDAALGAPLGVWKRALWLEGCAVPLERALRRSGLLAELAPPLRSLLRDVGAVALRNALALPPQLAAIAALASRHGIAIVALKGAARLLGGELPGLRSLSDIDILAAAGDAPELHRLVREELGFDARAQAPGHHLPRLERTNRLPVEIHTRLAGSGSPLDAAIWRDSRMVSVQGAPVAIPSATMLLLHTLEHAAAVHWAHRYRLRDVIDVAGAWTGEVDGEAVRAHVRRCPHRVALETLLSAAHDLEPRLPCPRPGAWRVVGRTGRARLTVAALARDTGAGRTTWVAGVIAEGAPASWARLAGLALRAATRRGRARRYVPLALAAAAVGHGCSGPTPPSRLEVPPFIFASAVEGSAALYRFRGDTVSRVEFSAASDTDPHVAAGRLVLASARDGNSEIYLADLDARPLRRITVDPAVDAEPALSPSGEFVVFMSTRSGSPRLWMADTAGGAPEALATGSSGFTSERAPAWSPDGGRIAFTSTRTGTSQVWVVGAEGGEAVQVSREALGAFAPAWSADGAAILYVTGTTPPRIKMMALVTSQEREFAGDPRGLGDPACEASLCLAVTNPYGAAGDVVAIARPGAPPILVASGAGRPRRPAFVRPSSSAR